MMGFLWGFLFSCLTVTALGQNCEDGWIYFNVTRTCYGIGQLLLNWVEAEDLCTFSKAKLAEIETEEENNFLKALATSKQAQALWLGAYDVFEEGRFHWVVGKGTLDGFTDWGDGQPNNYGPEGEDCLLMWPSYGYQWADAHCRETHHFICESM